VKPAFYDTLNSVALVFQEYDQSFIDVVGHTDS
jgi:outer membrane protein OmpA-like peptidoglycan-associated protein